MNFAGQPKINKYKPRQKNFLPFKPSWETHLLDSMNSSFALYEFCWRNKCEEKQKLYFMKINRVKNNIIFDR